MFVAAMNPTRADSNWYNLKVECLDVGVPALSGSLVVTVGLSSAAPLSTTV
jgi:hypothetical protein